MKPQQESERPRLGVWLIGARGSIATCFVYGLAGLREGLLEPTGIVTESELLNHLPLRDLGDMVVGGHEVASGDLSRSAGDLVRHGVLSAELVAAAVGDAAAFDARVRPGILDVADVGLARLDPASSRLSGLSPLEQAERLGSDFEDFRRSQGVDRLVVVNLASTEAWREPQDHWNSLADLEAAMESGGELPASSLYAYAAFRAGAAYVNFTPNRGSSLPALVELAREAGVPHCGNDGKTGETLLKSVLAPMFKARALRVLSWQGYNMLGNRDGEALSDPVRRAAKIQNKDQVVRSILGNPELHSEVGIDFVPSLHDWKTAWDFVHFEGFLGAKMSLQFTWSGCDSALAAPLVIDLVRLADLALERGEAGEMEHTACFFKSPLGGGSHDFARQFERLLAYGRER